MTYRTVADMADSTSLARREHAATAKEGIDPPEVWVFQRRWKLAAQPGWDAAWDSALAGHPDDGDPLTPPYDPGDDPGVITDGMILSAVQGLIQAEIPAPEPIGVVPGALVLFPSTYPALNPQPLTPWADDEFATFTDGEFQWDGDSWVAYVSAPPPVIENELPDEPGQ